MRQDLFDTYVNMYRTIHNKEDTLKMLDVHKSFLEYSKFEYSSKKYKEICNKIKHLEALKEGVINDVDMV